MLRAAFTILIPLALFIPLAAWIGTTVQVTPAERDAVAQQFVTAKQCRPEPGERLAYLAGLVLLPAGIFALSLWWRRWPSPARPGIVWWTGAVLLAVGLPLACWGCLSFANELEQGRWFHLRRNVFFMNPLLTLPVFAAVLAGLLWPRRPGSVGLTLSHAVALVLVLLVGLAHVFDEHSALAANIHFSAMFLPMVQVLQGKVLLVDAVNQYGLYPHLLAPLFSIVGLSVLKFTVVMGLLTAAALAGLWVVLAQATTNRLVAVLAFAALLFNAWWYFLTHGTADVVDVFFQYFPIRFVFPGLLVFLGWRYFTRPTPPLYWALWMFLAVGVLWNLDAGLPALAAWLAVLAFGEFTRGWPAGLRQIARHGAAALLILTVTLAAYAGAIHLTYGVWPDFTQMVRYQGIFYGAGFGMWPLPLPGLWMVVVLVYLAGLAQAASALASGTVTPRTRMVLLLSALGLGLFAYYQGRSHPFVLNPVSWPAFILAGLFLDELVLRLRDSVWRPVEWSAAALLTWIVAGSAVSLVGYVPSLGKTVLRNVGPVLAGGGSPLQAEAAVFDSSLAPEERFLAVGLSEALLHLEARRPSISPCGILQTLRIDDVRELDQVLELVAGVKVFVEKEDMRLAGWPGARPLVEFLEQGCEVLAETERGYLVQKGGLLLADDPASPPLLHVGFREEAVKPGVQLRPLPLLSSWTLEMVVKPDVSQVPAATLIGAWMGKESLSGLVIEQVEDQPDLFRVKLGDGRSWHEAARVPLTPGRWNYLAVTATKAGVWVYHDGSVVPGDNHPVKLHNGGAPLCLGDAPTGNHPFHGAIKEVRLLSKPQPPVDILRRGIALRQGP